MVRAVKTGEWGRPWVPSPRGEGSRGASPNGPSANVVLAARVRTGQDDFMKDATTFAWQKFGVTITTGLDAQLIELGFRSSLERPPGMAVSIMEMNNDAPHDGEMHPDGDEVIYVLEGRFSLRLGLNEPAYIEVAAGQAVVIPKGVWHKIHVLAPCRLVTVVPGPRIEYKLPTNFSPGAPTSDR